MGLGLSLAPGFVLLNVYFKEKLPLATAIAMTGGSIGGVVVPIALRKLLDEYLLSGSFLLLAAGFAQTIVFGALLTPPSEYKPRRGRDCEESLSEEEEKTQRLPARAKGRAQPRRRTQSEGAAAEDKTGSEIGDSSMEPLTKSLQTIHVQHVGRSDERVKRASRHRSVSGAIDILVRASSVGGSQSMSLAAVNFNGSMLGSDPVLFEGLADARIKETGSSQDDDDSDETRSCCRVARRKLSGSSVASLFGSPVFWLLIVYHFAGNFASGLPAFFLPFLAQEKGLTVTQGALLVTISGALDIVSRFAPGVLAQSKLVKPQTSVIVSMVIIGAMFQFTSFMDGMVSLTLMSIAYGLFAGVFYSMMALIIIDFTDLERFPMAFGINQLAIGISGSAGFSLFGECMQCTI